MIIKFKAKVLLSSEEQMEAEGTYDLGLNATGKKWLWRNIGISVEEVYKITEHKKNTTTLVELNGGEKILVQEPFEHVFEKWDKLKREIYAVDEGTEQENNDPEEKDTDEEDE